MDRLTLYELENINGGKLSSVSDWLLLGSSICFAYTCPAVGVPAAIIIAVFS